MMNSEARSAPVTEKNEIIGRVCSRRGCGVPLLDAAGQPDMRESRRFCKGSCRKADQTERMRLRRDRLRRAGRCPLCGQSCGDMVPGPLRETKHHEMTAAIFHGLYALVAGSENVTRQFVHQVATGKRTSKRIQAALARETRKLLKKLTEEAA